MPIPVTVKIDNIRVIRREGEAEVESDDSKSGAGDNINYDR